MRNILTIIIIIIININIYTTMGIKN